MTPTYLLIPAYIQMLTALSSWIDKAEDRGIDAGALLSARLAPDMFPLSTQLRFCCVQAYEGVARLRGTEFPQVWHDLLEEGRSGGDHPGSVEEVRTRIADTVSFLETCAADELDAGAGRSVAVELPDGRIFDMTAEQYIRDWALPHFYFHVMAAYAIMRAQGVDLGKGDYVRHAFAYLRPDTPGKPETLGRAIRPG